MFLISINTTKKTFVPGYRATPMKSKRAFLSSGRPRRALELSNASALGTLTGHERIFNTYACLFLSQ